jgi:hypothetical protein
VLGVVKSEPFQMNGKLQITSKPDEIKPNQERAAAEAAPAAATKKTL